MIQTPIGGSEPLQRSWLFTIFYNRKGIRSGWRLAVWFGLSLGGLIVVSVGAVLVLMVASGGRMPSTAPTAFLLYSEWMVFVPVFIAAVLVALVMEHRPVASLGFGFNRGWIRNLALGCGAGLAMLCIVMLVLMGVGAYSVAGLQEGLPAGLGWGLLMAGGFLGVGAFEEFLFRGYALQNLIDGLGLPAAAVISCALFAAIHLSNHGENPLGIADVLLAGIMFLVIAVRTRSLWLAVGVHAAWDWGQSFLFGVADSGTVLPGSLLQAIPHGPAWLTGGSAGPEGSVVGLVVNGLAILYFARASWIRADPAAAALWARFVSPREEPPQAAGMGAQSPPPPFAATGPEWTGGPQILPTDPRLALPTLPPLPPAPMRLVPSVPPLPEETREQPYPLSSPPSARPAVAPNAVGESAVPSPPDRGESSGSSPADPASPE